MNQAGKHFLNSPETLVVESLRGLCVLNPQVTLNEQNKIVHGRAHDLSKVALICGGGSGHEPAHAGYVGKGMLAAAVCGNVFASPNPSQIRKAIELVENNKGTVIIVKNYTGDVLNFGLAKEQFSALHPEKASSLRLVIVGDDVSVDREQGKIVGRRGLAGTILVYKIAGALADRGGNLDEVDSLATWIASRLATIGVSLGHTHVPGTDSIEMNISSSEIEIGMGIHNERGHKRLSPVPKLPELIPQLVDLMTSTTDPSRSFVPFKGRDNVVLLVNNLGGLSELEFGAIICQVKLELDTRGFTTSRVLAGTYMTSLNMPGFSLTLLLLPAEDEPDTPSLDLILSLLDDQPDILGWKSAAHSRPSNDVEVHTEDQKNEPTTSSLYDSKLVIPGDINKKIEKVAKALISAEPEITRMDVIAGDGDCGLTLKAGAEAVLAKLNSGDISGDDIVGSLIKISQIAEEVMGGTSGALYSIFFSALVQSLQPSAKNGEITGDSWGKALDAARVKLYTYTRARPPSRTLVDPLAAFIDTYINSQGDYLAAVKAAVDATEATKDMDAKAGRSAYLDENQLKKERVPDPGAWGIKVILENL